MHPSELVEQRFPEHFVERHRQHGDDTVVVRREGLLEVLEFLRDELGFKMPVDVTCVDLLGLYERPEHVRAPLNPRIRETSAEPLGSVPRGEPRFEVVYHLRNIDVTPTKLVRVKVRVPEDDAVVPSAVGLFKGFDWFEREVYDMFGVRFEGHPDLRRILLYEGFEGHPLRKDYPRRGYQPRVPMPRLEGDEVPTRGGDR